MALTQALQAFYGGIDRTCVTLFRALTGDDWGKFVAPLASISWVWAVLWLVYMLCAICGLMNIFTGIVIG